MVEVKSFNPVEGVLVGYKRVRSKGLWAGFVISVFVVLLGIALVAYPPMSSRTEASLNGVLMPQEYYKIWVNMERGEKLVVSGTVSGGNNDILIFVKEGRYKVRDLGWVDNPVHVVFTAPEDGNYTLYISNAMSIVTSKDLDLRVIYKYHNYFPGVILLVVGAVLAIINVIALVVGRKDMMIKVGSETYELWRTFRGVKVKVNGVELDTKIKAGEKFKIGSSSEHILEVRYVRGRLGAVHYGIFLDGSEVGRL